MMMLLLLLSLLKMFKLMLRAAQTEHAPTPGANEAQDARGAVKRKRHTNDGEARSRSSSSSSTFCFLVPTSPQPQLRPEIREGAGRIKSA